MAKMQDGGEQQEIKKLANEVKKIINYTTQVSKQVTAARGQAEEQAKINKELLKLISLLESGFAQTESDARELIDNVNEGLEVTDEFAKRWAKERKASNSDIEKLLKRFRELEKVDTRLIDNIEDYIDLLDDKLDLIEDEYDLTKKILRNYDEIADAIQSSKTTMQKLGSSAADINSSLDKMVRKKFDIVDMFSGFAPSLSSAEMLLDKINSDIDSTVKNASGLEVDIPLQFSPLTEQLNKELKNVLDNIEIEKGARLESLQTFFKENSRLTTKLSQQMAANLGGLSIGIDIDTGAISNVSGQLNEGSKQYKKVISDLQKSMLENNVVNSVNQYYGELVNLFGIGIDRTDEQNARYATLVGKLDTASKIMLQELEIQYDLTNGVAMELQMRKDALIMLNAHIGKLQSAEKLVLKIGDAFDYINSVLPSGVGDFLGLSKISENLLESHRKGVKGFSDELLKSGNQAEALQSYFTEFGPAIRSALNPMTLLIAGTVMLGKFLFSVVDRYKDMASEMNVSIKQAKMLLDTQFDIVSSQKNQFATMEDIQAIQSEMIGSRGKLINLTTQEVKELTISLAETGRVFGYGAKEAAKLHEVFRNIGADDKLALNLQQTIGLMAEAAQISPQMVADDLIESSEEVAIYFAGMPQKAADAAIQTRKMGMSLKQAGEIAQKMLNLEGFMTDMYELQAMTGGGIDFSSAFDKGLMGDIQGMTKDIMNSIGSSAQLDKMHYTTRMKIANTLGMSVEDLKKSVRFNEQMKDLGVEQGAQLEMYRKRLGDISNLNKDEIRDRMQQLQSTDRLGVAWEKIKAVLIKSIIPLAESLADGIDAISPVIDIVVMGLKGVGIVIKGLVPLIKGMLFPFKFIGDIISKITGGLDTGLGKLDQFSSVSASLEKFFSKIGDIVYVIGAGIGTWFAITKFATIISSILGGLGSILKFLPGIGTLFTALTGNIGGTFAKAKKDAVDTSKQISEPMQRMVGNVQTSINSMVQSVKTSMADMVQSIKASAGEINKSLQGSTSVGDVIGKAEKASKKIKEVGTGASAELEKSSKKLKDTTAQSADSAVESLEKVKKKSKGGIIDEKLGASAFGVFGEVASKAMAAFVARSALSFFTARKEGEEQMGQLAQSVNPLMEMAVTGLAPLVTSYITEGLEKVFTKRLEKKFEKGFEPALDKVKGKIGETASFGSRVFGGLKKVVGGAFDGLGNLTKMLSPIDTTAQSFDGMANKVEKLKGSIKKDKTISEQVETKVRTKKDKLIKSTQVEPTKSPIELNETGIMGKIKALKRKLTGEKLELPQNEIELPEFQNDKKIAEPIKKIKGKLKSERLNLPQKTIELPTIEDKKTNTLVGKIKKVKDFILETVFGFEQSNIEPPTLDGGKLETATDTLSKKVRTKKIELDQKRVELPQLDKDGPSKLSKRIDSLKNIISGAFTQMTDIIKSVWSGLKTTLTEIVTFVADTMRTLGSGIGDTIKSILTGIGDGLNSFKSNAVKGAASLLIVSGAIWVTSKAMQNFSQVSWEDVSKGIVTLGGLSIAAMALGKASGQILIGSAAIAILGASLLPAAYALQKFNEVDWTSLAKAGVALIGLGAVGTLLSGFAPTMILAAAGIAALGAAMIPLVYSLKQFNEIDWSSLGKAATALVGFGAIAGIFGTIAPVILAGSAALAAGSLSVMLFGKSIEMLNTGIKSLDVKPLNDLLQPLQSLMQISGITLLGISAGITSIGAALLGLNAFNTVNKAVSSLFGGSGFIDELQKLGDLAQPIDTVAKAINSLVVAVDTLDGKKLNVDMGDFAKIEQLTTPKTVEMEINKKLQPTIQRIERDNTNYVENRITSNPLTNSFTTQPPPKSAVAQNVQIKPPVKEAVAQNVKIEAKASNLDRTAEQQTQKGSNPDIYNKSNDFVSDLQPLQFVVQQILQVLQQINQKDVVVALDGQTLNKNSKKYNNN